MRTFSENENSGVRLKWVYDLSARLLYQPPQRSRPHPVDSVKEGSLRTLEQTSAIQKGALVDWESIELTPAMQAKSIAIASCVFPIILESVFLSYSTLALKSYTHLSKLLKTNNFYHLSRTLP